MANFDEVIASLESVSEQLAEIGMDALREAIAAGSSQRPAAERAATRARGQIERTAHMLRRAASDEGDEEVFD